MKIVRTGVLTAASIILATSAMAQSGPVATSCEQDIAKYCAGKKHGDGEVRDCLEDNIDKVTADCKTALETTGGGQGRGGND